VTVGRRLWDLARANLNDFATALLEGGPDADAGVDAGGGASEASPGHRAGRAARRVRDAAEDAWERAFEAAQARQAGHGSSEDDVGRWYRTLELEPGADLEQVRRAYRRLIRRYHPDRYVGDPEKYAAATQVATRVTEAYNGLRARLGAPTDDGT
jgi:hypothetical protein